ncbi:hypothetical protein FPOA_09497 [Fusarium poae]|uniref:Uncharacterized protein n=1 Tax=Fusarium poae TaxID=36050 RepID=A0A1B8ABD5_FUSPO|nr:hypothetical protein FPOA_09497 [Fusarium poae]
MTPSRSRGHGHNPDPDPGPPDPILNLRGGADDNANQPSKRTSSGRAFPAVRRGGQRAPSRRVSTRPMSSREGPTPESTRLPFGRRDSIRPTIPVEGPVPGPTKRTQDPHPPGSSPDPTSPSKPRVKRARPSAMVPQRDRIPMTNLSIDQHQQDLGTSFMDQRSDVPLNYIYYNFERYNQDKVKNAIEGMKVEMSHLVSPARQGIEKSIDLLLSLPKLYDYTPFVKSHTKDIHLDIKRHPVVWALIAKSPTGAAVRMIAHLPQEFYTEKEANLVCEAFIDILNRWPGDLSLLIKEPAGFKSGSFHARLLTSACRHRVLPYKTVVCPLPAFRKAKEGPKVAGIKKENHFDVWVSCIDPTTYKQREDQKEVGIRAFGPDTVIPEPSEKYQFVVFDNRGGIKKSISRVQPNDGQPSFFPSVLPDESELQISSDEREGLHNAERLCRLYSATITTQGGLINTQSCRNIWKSLLDKYGAANKHVPGASRGTFGGSDLLQVNTMYGQLSTRISAGRTLMRHLLEINEEYQLPAIIIRSVDRAWVIGVEQAISDAWILEGDILKAWQRGAEAADLANQSIKTLEKPPLACVCTPEMAQTETHYCSNCGGLRVCNQLVATGFDGRRVCRSCSTRLQARPLGNQVVEYLYGALKTKMTLEQRASKGDITDTEKKSTQQQCLEVLKNLVPNKDEVEQAGLPVGMTWRDSYSKNLYSLPDHITTTKRTQPNRPSIDSVFPAWLTPLGYRIHCPENIVVTLQAVNYAKHIQIPAFMAMVSWYVNQRTRIEQAHQPNIWGSEARAELDELEKKMIKISKRLRIIRLTFGWTRYRRLTAKMVTKEQFQKDLAPLISGRLQPELLESMERLDTVKNFASTPLAIRFPEEELSRIRTLVQEIQDFFHVQLPRGPDGCPYFAHPLSMPTEWNWRVAWRLGSERLERMRRACNRHWPTYDTIETILLECIFQVCINKCVLTSDDPNYHLQRHLKAKYSSLLELPLVMAYHDGLTFALGHAEHGKGMYTGWPSRPHRLDERLEGDDSNNIRVESRTENFLKADYDESTYPDLKKMIMDIDMPKDVYDNTLKPQALSKEERENLVWNGEELGDDLFKESLEFSDPMSEIPDPSETSGEAMPADVGQLPLSQGAPAKTVENLSMRVKSDQTDYSEGLSAGELDEQWTQTMTGQSESLPAGDLTNQWAQPMPFQATSRNPSLQTVYSDSNTSETMEQRWSLTMQNTMQGHLDEVMRLVESRPTLDSGFRGLLDSLREAKNEGDDASFMAILAVIRAELS